MSKVKLGKISSLRASGKEVVGTIDVTKMRTLTAKVKVTYAAGATDPVRLNYYSKLSNNLVDTVPIDYEDITLTAGATVQKTIFIASPEEGEVIFEVENRDSANAATDVEVWLTYERWS